MNRRRFLRDSVVGSATVVTVGCQPTPTETASPAQAGSSTAVRVPPFELDEATVASLQEGMSSGKYSAKAITELYLGRIDALDKQGPSLHSVIEVNPDAVRIAEELDAERRSKGPRGPLHGIPVLVKDNVDTGDRMATSAGSLALEGSRAAADSFVARRLRDAGAVILGKANMSEWANFRSTRSVSGWSGRGGQCRNPYVLDRNACGSSSGSGTATAANLTALAIGTETNGSIVCPSTTNGLVGIKPTLGLVSRSGIIPIAHSQDTAGPMCRTVRDAAILLGALTGVDPQDSATSESQGKTSADYTTHLDPNGLKGARIGVARKFFGFHPDVDKLMADAIDVMKKSGAEIIDPVDFSNVDLVNETQLEVLLFEFKADLNAYLAGLGANAQIKSLKDAISFNEQHKDREMPVFGQELFLRAEEKGPLTDKAYLAALAHNHKITRAEGIDREFGKHRLDAVIAPTGGPAWVIDHVNGDHFTGGSSTPAAVAGYPNITVPCGYVRDLPIGISFFGKAWSEPVLLRVAYAYEQATQFRKPPKFIASLSIG